MKRRAVRLTGHHRWARVLAAAEVLVGGARHLTLLPGDPRPRISWRSPLTATLPEILALRPRQVAVLATGDPLWYGIGRLLLQHLSPAEVTIVPHVSAFQEACSRLGWTLEEALPLSAHGRPVTGLRRDANGEPVKLYWNSTGSSLSTDFKAIGDELSNLCIVS